MASFPTSLRRNPGDPRSLLQRLDAQLRERIEEACEFSCLDLLVKLRSACGRPAPQPDNQADRSEFKQLVREFVAALEAESRGWVPTTDTLLHAKLLEQQSLEEPLPLQILLAKSLPDYWQRFERASQAFVQGRLTASSPHKSFLGRLINVKRKK